MGAFTSEKYESLEKFETLDNTTTQLPASAHLKTSPGNVEHNGEKDRKAGDVQAWPSQPMGPVSAIMANDVLIQPDSETTSDLPSTEGHELDSFLGKAFEEKPIWKDLYEK